jgi:2-polyprenyl-6-methoxyphenol hydroxylase-like FAD-dependent oxidoreductase
LTNQPPLADAYDVIVIGARPAGAGTALCLAHRGLRVLLIDRGRYGTDTTSTHALMRAGVMQLERWGVLSAIIAAKTPPITAASFIYNGESITIPVKPRDGIDALYAPRRTVLDRVIVDAAAAAGATVAFGTSLVDLVHSSGGRVIGAIVRSADDHRYTIRASLVVGADGRYSTVARLVSAETTSHGRYSTANIYGYWKQPGAGEYRWYYADGASAGMIPTNDGRTCVFGSVPSEQLGSRVGGDLVAGYQSILKQAAPDAESLLARDAAPDRLYGFAGMRGYLKQPVGPGWALVGDAAYFKDPLTAHGLTDALVEAEYLAAAIADGSDAALTGYARSRDERVRALFDVTDRIASCAWTMDEARAMHKQLAAAMSAEVNALRAFTTEVTFV